MCDTATFHTPTRLVFGPGAIGQIGSQARELGMAKAPVVTSPSPAKVGIAGQILERLATAGLEGLLFAEVEPNPAIGTCERATASYRQAACDGLIAVGGGSPLDVAKVAGIVATNGGPCAAYVGRDKVSRPLPPLLEVPTTVGTGAEVTPFAVITDPAQRKKVVVWSSFIVPPVALLDPELTLPLPGHLVAYTHRPRQPGLASIASDALATVSAAASQ